MCASSDGASRCKVQGCKVQSQGSCRYKLTVHLIQRKVESFSYREKNSQDHRAHGAEGTPREAFYGGARVRVHCHLEPL